MAFGPFIQRLQCQHCDWETIVSIETDAADTTCNACGKQRMQDTGKSVFDPWIE